MTLSRGDNVQRAVCGGFTVVELAVVMAVIGILLGIVMPALRHGRLRAQQVVCEGQLRDCGLVFSMYCSEHEGRFMAASGRVDGGWVDLLASKDSDDALMCPATLRGGQPRRAAVTEVGGRSEAWTLRCDEGRTVQGSYGINGWVYEDDEGAKGLAWGSSLVAGSSNVPVLLDSMWVAGKFREGDRPPTYDGELPRDMVHGMRGPDSLYFCIDRHADGVNGLFLDWSVRSVGLKELWRLKWNRKYGANGTATSSVAFEPRWPAWMKDR